MLNLYFMRTMSSTEARRNFSEFLDQGSRQPIIVTRQKRQIGAFVPMEDMERLRKLRMKELGDAARAASAEANAKGLTEAVLREILNEVNPS
jgi:prevent-host-death family protein